MAISDADYNFITIDVGAYGSAGDSRRLRLWKNISAQSSYISHAKTTSGHNNTCAICVCDEDFKISTYQLRPYSQRALMCANVSLTCGLAVQDA